MSQIALYVKTIALCANLTYGNWVRRGCLRRGGTREHALESHLLHIKVDRLPRHGLAVRVEEWLSNVRLQEQFASFDAWLRVVATPAKAAIAGICIEQDSLKFELHHGRRYAIEDDARGARKFDCIIDSRVPLIAFLDAADRPRPWITVKRLFTVEEIVSMRQL